MTVPVQDTINRATGNGVTTVFPFSFYLLSAADLVVTIDGVVITTGFTVNGVGVQAGGDVTFAVAPASGDVILERVITLERTTDYQQAGDFFARVVNPDFDRLWMAQQQHRTAIDRSIKIPVADEGINTTLPAAAARANLLLGFDNSGNPVTVAPAAQSATALQAILAASAGASLVGFSHDTNYPAGTLGAKAKRIVNIADAPYNASASNTEAENKTALQSAITAVGAAGGGQIIVDYGINYGLKTRTPSTWPDFAGITSPIIINDYSTGDTQDPAVYPAAYDGAMYRVWTCTPQTTAPGQHDGNTQWLRAAWAPTYCISNDMKLAAVGDPSRTATDNRRAYYATMVDGECSWQLGNGNLSGAGYTDEELSNFVIQKFAIAGDTLGSFAPYQVERKTGNASYGGGRSIPSAHHHFEAVAGSPTLNIGMFESKGVTCAVTLRNSNGSGDDVEIKNISGDMQIAIPALGAALTVKKSNRYVGIGESVPAYRLDVSESRNADYVSRMRNTSATNGSILRMEATSASGSGFNFLNAYSGGTADVEFQLNGSGTGYCDGSWTGGGADYAEFFEWLDGNPDNEDRRGFSVALVGNKIKKAESGDVLIGVISGNPSVVGDSAWNKWAGKYLRDDFGACVLEADPDNEGGQRRKLNPAFDPEAKYTPREQRKEWDCVGLIGKLRVRNGQPTSANWIKMRDISDSVSEWLVR